MSELTGRLLKFKDMSEENNKWEKPKYTLGDIVWVIAKFPKKITECVVDSIRYDTF